MKTYNIRIHDTGNVSHLEAVPAIRLHGTPVPCIAHRDPNPKLKIWSVTEITSGFAIAHGDTRQHAIANAMQRMTERPGEAVCRDLAAKAVARFGAANPL